MHYIGRKCKLVERVHMNLPLVTTICLTGRQMRAEDFKRKKNDYCNTQRPTSPNATRNTQVQVSQTAQSASTTTIGIVFRPRHGASFCTCQNVPELKLWVSGSGRQTFQHVRGAASATVNRGQEHQRHTKLLLQRHLCISCISRIVLVPSPGLGTRHLP